MKTTKLMKKEDLNNVTPVAVLGSEELRRKLNLAEAKKIKIETLYDVFNKYYLQNNKDHGKLNEFILEQNAELNEYFDEADKAEKIEFKNDKAKEKWDEIVRVNNEGKAKETIEYATRVVKMLQYLRNKYKRRICDVGYLVTKMAGENKLDGTMQRYALAIIEEYWYYGEQIRKI